MPKCKEKDHVVFLMFGLLALYTAFSPTHTRNGTWGGIKIKTVLDPKSCIVFLRLALPGILMVGTEWYIFIASYRGQGS
jgi:MATE family multidrug resistance protein